MSFELPDLPYPMDALEPHMSAETLRFHHGKHHRSYVEKLNKAISGTRFAEMPLEVVIQSSADSEPDKGVFNNAAQHWNHSFFWECMTKDGGGRPKGELARAIDDRFGGFDDFATSFVEAAASQFGSGWAWLVLEAGRPRISTTPNAVPPMVLGQQALLTCDVWEHAYYLDYQNRRPDFVKAFLEHLVNWDFVATQFALQGEGGSVAARRFRDAQEDFASSGQVEDRARAAGKSLDGPEAEALEKARVESAQRAAEEDPALDRTNG